MTSIFQEIIKPYSRALLATTIRKLLPPITHKLTTNKIHKNLYDFIVFLVLFNSSIVKIYSCNV